MRILDRLVLAETAVAVGGSTAVLLFLLTTLNVLKQVSSAVATGQVSGWEGLELVLLLIPGLLPYVLPLGTLTGILLAFGRLGAQSELTAMKAGGVSLARTARPALAAAGALAILSAWLNLEVAPRANTEFRRLLMGAANDNPAAVIVPGQVNRSFKGMLIRAAGREGEVLSDFWAWRVDEAGRLVQTVHAKEARIVREPGPAGSSSLRIELTGARWDSREGGVDRPASFASAETASLDLPEAVGPVGGVFERKLRWLTTSELLAGMKEGRGLPPEATPEQREASKSAVRTQLASHLAGAFSIFALALLAVPLAVRVGRKETFVNAAVGLAVALSYYLLTSATGWVKDPGLWPEAVACLPALAVAVGGWILLAKASRH
ncbi:MAG: LptF/LptG family permease [Opitutales bacterium]